MNIKYTALRTSSPIAHQRWIKIGVILTLVSASLLLSLRRSPRIFSFSDQDSTSTTPPPPPFYDDEDDDSSPSPPTPDEDDDDTHPLPPSAPTDNNTSPTPTIRMGSFHHLTSKHLAKHIFDVNLGQRKPREKFFMYRYNGGFNNQRDDLETALLLTTAFFPDRTLVVPVISSHMHFASEMWRHHTLPADVVFDAQLILESSPHLKVIAMTTLLVMRDFSAIKIASLVMDTEERKKKPLRRAQIERLARAWKNEQVVYFGGDSMWQSFGFTSEERRRASRHVRFESHFRRAALSAITTLFSPQPGGYVSTHIREGDFYKAHPNANWLKDVDAWFLNATTSAMTAREITGIKQMYVCTEKSSVDSFPKLASRFHLVGFNDVLNINATSQGSPWTTEIEPLLPTNRARTDEASDSLKHTLIGVVEMLIASCAEVFVGSPESTFSEGIEVIRENRDVLFPECERRMRNG